MIVLRPDKI